MRPTTVPSRRAQACGALGRYDRDRVARVAAALAPEMQVAHEGRDAMLMLDRPAIRWSTGRRSGLAWSERMDPVAGGEVTSWQDIATEGAACSLVVGGRRPMVHSTVSGVATVYYLRGGSAVYFCSRIDPLLEAADGLLTADWEAWAGILALVHALGDRTPFEEVRRLPPFSTLECRRGRSRVREERWPWAEVEPHDRVEEAAGEALERMREAVARLPDGSVACPLSGGWDSRLLLGLLAERRRSDLKAITISNDDGLDREERFSAAVAAHLGVPHETCTGAMDAWWEDASWFAFRTDYQVMINPWLVPLIPRLRYAAVVADGLGLDVLGESTTRYLSRAAIDAGGGPGGPPELWKTYLSRLATPPYRPVLTRALHAAARRQLLRESERFEGHPSRLLLTHWRNRTVRGISLNPHSALGSELPIATPFPDDSVARALLSASPKAKFGGQMYRALYAALDPALGALPSTNTPGLPPEPRDLPMRRRTPNAARGFAELLLDSPLTPYLHRKEVRRLTREERGRRPRMPMAGLPPAYFTLWHRRYESRLREVDPADLLV